MKTISTTAFHAALQQGQHDPTVAFVDVRTPLEYEDQHIEGVRNIPLDELLARRAEFAEAKTVYLHCRSGARSSQAASLLESLHEGTAEYINVDGGIAAWAAAGFPTSSAEL